MGRGKDCYKLFQRLLRPMLKAVTTHAKGCYGGSEALQQGEGAYGTTERSLRNNRKQR